jgi:hypothetical protein
MPSPSRSLNWLSPLLALGLLIWRPAPAQEAPPVPGYRAPRPFNLPFLIRPEEWYYSREQGMLMLCPAHAHGPKSEATAELIRLAARHRAPVPATIWVCRADQLNTLREFAPMVDRVCINPFVYGSTRGTAIREPPWTGTSHPFLMQAQDIRLAAPGRQLVACIDVDGRESRFGKRHPTFEEVQWMTLAAVGSGFQGIAWRGHADDLPYKDRLDLLTGNILRYGDKISRAQPVDWVAATSPAATEPLPVQEQPAADGQQTNGPIPFSALQTKSHLFVVLLHPQLMLLRPGKTNISLPLSPLDTQTCSVAVRPPSGVSLVSAERLDGTPLALRHDGDRVLVSCRFAGGGTMLVFNLKGQP